MRTLVVGDIHGCYHELLALMERAALTAADQVIALGDVVDRGPQPLAVLELLRARPGARSILGNHERKHVRAALGEIAPARSQRITRLQCADHYAEALAWMAALPPSLSLPEALLVHGFWEPGVPLADQRLNVIVGSVAGERYLLERYGRPWYELYDGPQPLIVGHRDYRADGQPLIYRDRVFALDTGCVYGRALTGLVLPDFQVVSTPSRGQHWAATQAAYPTA